MSQDAIQLAYRPPRYAHDCEACRYLGQFENYDLYYHPGANETIVARFGSEGPDYLSGIGFSVINPAIALGATRAIALGIMDPMKLGSYQFFNVEYLTG